MDSIDLDDTGAAKWLDAYRQARRNAEEWGRVAEHARRRVEEALGDAEEGRLGGRPVVSWRWTRPPRRFELARLRKERPDVAAAYEGLAAPTRRFTLIDDQ